jgi:hypothetical protein
MQKKPLLVYKWDRSKIYCCWDNETELPDQITVKVDSLFFKMGLFDEWLKTVKTNE